RAVRFAAVVGSRFGIEHDHSKHRAAGRANHQHRFQKRDGAPESFQQHRSVAAAGSADPLSRALDDFEKTKRNLLFQVGQAYFDYRKTVEGVANAAEKQKLEEKEAELAEIQVGLNEATLPDLMSALGRKAAAKVEFHNVQAAYFNSLSELNRAVGGVGIFPA